MSNLPAGDREPVDAPRAQLRRSRRDRVVAGVCGGLGHYLGVDPVIVRIVAVVLVLTGGSGIILYLIGWVVIPEEDPDERSAPPAGGDASGAASLVAGAVLIGLGSLLLLNRVVPEIGRWTVQLVLPVLLIAIGLALLLRRNR